MYDHEYIDKINDKVYLGCFEGSKDLIYFQKEGIANVLTLIKAASPIKEVNHMIISIDDDERENIYQHFIDAIKFIENSEKVYIHCIAGVSRSPSVVIAYLMWKEKLSFNDAYWKVKNRRRWIDPNPGFRKQLKNFEITLKENDYNIF
jgi:dual specificity MAP kinase phosphatase